MQYVLRSCFDHITGAPLLTQEWSSVTSNVLKHFAHVWKLCEEAAKKREEAEASLYRFKSHTHIVEEDKDETELVNDLFPDYDKEFTEDNAEKTESMDCHEEEEQQPIMISDSVSISIDTITEVCLVHLLSSNIQVPFIDYYNPSSSFTVAYHLANSLYKELNTIPGTFFKMYSIFPKLHLYLGITIEQCGIGSHVLMCSTIFTSMESTTPVDYR